MVVVDNCDSLTGWAAVDSGLISLNTTTKVEGTGAINLYTAGSEGAMEKTTTSIDFTDKELQLWVYIKDSSALSNIDNWQVRFGSSSSDFYFWGFSDTSTFPLKLQVGWNKITLNKASRSGELESSSIDEKAFDYFKIHFDTSGAITEADIIIDDIKALPINRNIFLVKNNGVWEEFDQVEFFKIRKRANQINEFEVKLFDVTTAQKSFFKEQAEVLFFSGTKMILKGRIQTIEYGDEFLVIARGFGVVEAKLIDKKFIKDGDDRIQYTNASAQTIAIDINTGLDSNPILTTASSGLFDTDFGQVSVRFEQANRMKSIAKLAEIISYEWWGSQTSSDNYEENFINIASTRGNKTHPNLIAHYKLNDNAASTVVIDSIGSFNGTSVNNTDTMDVEGKINNALEFNGVDDTVTMPNDVSLSSDNSFTISVWSNHAPVTGKTSSIISLRPSALRGIGIDVNPNGDTIFKMRDDTEASEVAFTTIPTGWHHYVATYNADTNTMEAFFDGVSQGTTTHTTTIISTENNIGSDNIIAGSQADFVGKIDDVRIYNSKLSVSDIASIYNNGNGTESETNKVYNINVNATVTSQERDLNNLANHITFLGYGDGINQLKTTTFAASTQNSILNANIASTNTSIELLDASEFDATGTARIAEEQIAYAGVSSNTLTGCTRGTNSTTAKEHFKTCYIEKFFPVTNSQTGSSIEVYGLTDDIFIERTFLSEPSAELLSSKVLLERKDPIERIKVFPDEPFEDVALLDIGDRVSITSSESNIDGDFDIVGINYEDNFGALGLGLEISNRSLEFIEQMNKQREEERNLGKYMQGATNIYAVAETENMDADNPLNMRAFIPNQAVSINDVLLNFRNEPWRSYGQFTITESALLNPKTIISAGLEGSEILINVTDSGVADTGTALTLVDNSQSWGVNDYLDLAIKITAGDGSGQVRLVSTNSSNTITINRGWDTIPVSASSEYAIVVPFTSSINEELNLTTEFASVGAGNWANVKFESAGGGTQGENYTGSTNDHFSMQHDRYTGQNFTIGTVAEDANFVVNSIDIKVHREDTPGTATLNIYNVDGNLHPTGAPISSGTFDGDALTSADTGEIIEVTMSSVTLTGSTVYSIQAETTAGDGSGDTVRIHMQNTNPYAGGVVFQTLDGGSSYNNFTGSDLYFNIKGVDVGKVRIEADLFSQIFLEST